jgi:hypothetical protein
MMPIASPSFKTFAISSRMTSLPDGSLRAVMSAATDVVVGKLRLCVWIAATIRSTAKAIS